MTSTTATMAAPVCVETILAGQPAAGRDALIPILQEVQEAEGHLSKDSVLAIAKHLKLPASKIYGVATFYNQFRFKAQGKYHVQVCRGTACHVKGSAAVLDELQRELGVEAGATTRDGLFSLEVVACVGACGLAPAMCIEGEYYAGVTTEKVKGILDEYRTQATEEPTSD